MKSCRRCKYWQRIGELSIGACCRFPPSIPHEGSTSGAVYKDGEMVSEGIRVNADFPRVGSWGWCGEWSERERGE